MYEIVYKRRAARALQRLPRNTARRIVEKLEALARTPFSPDNDVVALHGRPGYRLRVGGWWVIFLINESELVILVLDVLPRGDAYK